MGCRLLLCVDVFAVFSSILANKTTLGSSSAKKKVAYWPIRCPGCGFCCYQRVKVTPTRRATPSSRIPEIIVDVTYTTFFLRSNPAQNLVRALFVVTRAVARFTRYTRRQNWWRDFTLFDYFSIPVPSGAKLHREKHQDATVHRTMYGIISKINPFQVLQDLFLGIQVTDTYS